MNTSIKVAVGAIAGLIAGAMLVGTAVAAPRIITSPAFNGYLTTGATPASDTSAQPTIAEMNAFMDRYRTSDGSIDVDRMHDDVASGKVTPPCAGSTPGTPQSTEDRNGGDSYRRGPAMMQGWSSGDGPIGYGMMGSTY